MLHELGHFATAKWSGMKATEYFVGFGPRLWSIRRGETEYGVKAFPLGGYVKILGMTSMEELDPSDEPRSFVNQSTSKRVLVASAGLHRPLRPGPLLAIFALWFIGTPHAGRYAAGHGADPAVAPDAGPARRPAASATSSSRSTASPRPGTTIRSAIEGSKGRRRHDRRAAPRPAT